MEEEQIEPPESQVWNISLSYTRMLMDFIEQFNKINVIAIFGTSDIYGDVFNRDNNLKSTARLKAIPRLIDVLHSMIRLTKFLLPKKVKTKFESHNARLLKISKNLFKLRLEKKRGKKIIELNIDEDFFNHAYQEIINIFSDIMFELNRIGLVFPRGEEKDVKTLKRGFDKRFLMRT